MRWLCFILLLAQSACVSTYVVFDSKWDKNTKPSYVDYFDSYLGGFIGHPSVQLAKVCLDQKPLAVRRYKSWEDGILTLVTATIYSPSTVAVWCGD